MGLIDTHSILGSRNLCYGIIHPQALKEMGAADISMYVTHAVFPQQSWETFTQSPEGVSIRTFWITDSIPHSLEICEVPPFKLIPLCDVIADNLLGSDLLSYNHD